MGNGGDFRFQLFGQLFADAYLEMGEIEIEPYPQSRMYLCLHGISIMIRRIAGPQPLYIDGS